ncbi:gamma-glutamylcysteine synthetase [Streptococcus pneumoniae]|uniref:gamma-glutamylcysteine synthetase n=1 Tax=Streptococcus pneumoniae TaxID=1313 RepID=UPI0010CE929B|nr:gamma-glutamylcysteine synthetase [Streptococcus pneumoniae]VJX74611.1 gamma-glutamylcysteine synthetase putative [Streptococcus pneumoniae]VTY26600.1 glu_cys_lig_pln: glutamate--cysteine ligase [Streptococcus pneumoniae]
MSCSIDLLKHRYLKNIKENPELFVGIELEYPVASLEGDATDVEVIKDLFHYLVSTLDLTVAKVDDFGNLIQLVDPISQDAILFEVSYTTIEFAFGKAETIQEVEERFSIYMEAIQKKLAESNHAIVGCGIHPNWDKNENCPVAYPRYQMLMDYLNLSRNIIKSDLHHFPEYGTFICGSQVQLDISKTNYLRVINAFTQIEAAKAYLFANSEFSGADWDTKISRDIFWEESIHGIYPENVGVNARLLNDEADFFDYLNHSAIFTAERDGQTYYFYPIQAGDYLATPEIQAFALNGDEVIIYPQEKDFETHRSYQYQDLTTRGTVEFRSVCTQPLDRTFASAAFHLGLLVNLDKLEAYLETAPFFKVFGYDYKFLRRQFSKKNLTDEEETMIIEFSKDLLLLAEEGLVVRNKEEMTYLQPLREELSL